MVATAVPKRSIAVAPQRRKMSYEEYLEFAPDSRIVEWVDGEVIIYMPPIYTHQNIVGFLGTLLKLFVDFLDLGYIILYYAVPLDEDGVYHSTVLPGFWLKAGWLWPEELPDPHITFAEIIRSTGNLPDEVRAAYQTIQKWLEEKETGDLL